MQVSCNEMGFTVFQRSDGSAESTFVFPGPGRLMKIVKD
jgi:hypothetical protein